MYYLRCIYTYLFLIHKQYFINSLNLNMYDLLMESIYCIVNCLEIGGILAYYLASSADRARSQSLDHSDEAFGYAPSIKRGLKGMQPRKN